MLQKQFVTVWKSVPFYLHYNNIKQTAAKVCDLTTTVFVYTVTYLCNLEI